MDLTLLKRFAYGFGVGIFVCGLAVSAMAEETNLQKRFNTRYSNTGPADGAGGVAFHEMSQDQQALMTSAKDLEAVLISNMIEPMFPEGKESGLFGGGGANSVYRTLMIQEYGKVMSNSGGIGVAQGVYNQLDSDTIVAKEQN